MFSFLQTAGVCNNNHAVNNIVSMLVDSIEETKKETEVEFLQFRMGQNVNYNNVEECGTLYDITKFIPMWVVYEKQNRIGRLESGTTIYDFLQKYYDWLYCDGPSGAQYGLSRNILDLIDVKRTKDSLIKNLYSTYGDSFSGIFTSNTLDVGRAELEKFLTGIRKNFYHRKGTEDGLRKLFTTLFVIDESDIEVEIPKRLVIRLNGGKFYDPNFSFRTNIGDTGDYLERGDLGGSYLNYSRLQDSTWFHDHNYLVFIGDKYNGNEDIAEIYRKSNHPAGIGLIFGKQVSDFSPVIPDSESAQVCEYPMLKNYAAYRIGGTYAALGIINGVTFYGLTACTGCCGASFSGFTGPTYRFPSWTNLTTASEFKDINILDFLTLCYDTILASPNNNLTCNGCP